MKTKPKMMMMSMTSSQWSVYQVGVVPRVSLMEMSAS